MSQDKKVKLDTPKSLPKEERPKVDTESMEKSIKEKKKIIDNTQTVNK